MKIGFKPGKKHFLFLFAFFLILIVVLTFKISFKKRGTSEESLPLPHLSGNFSSNASNASNASGTLQPLPEPVEKIASSNATGNNTACVKSEKGKSLIQKEGYGKKFKKKRVKRKKAMAEVKSKKSYCDYEFALPVYPDCSPSWLSEFRKEVVK